MADRWLTRPDFDAHVVVIAEREPGQQISLPAMTKVVIENAQRVSKASSRSIAHRSRPIRSMAC